MILNEKIEVLNMVQYEHTEKRNFVAEKTAAQARVKLRKQALVYSLTFVMLDIIGVIITRLSNFDYFSFYEPIGFTEFIALRIITVTWVYFNSRNLRVEPILWAIYSLLFPLLTAFLIGITKDSPEEGL